LILVSGTRFVASWSFLTPPAPTPPGGPSEWKERWSSAIELSRAACDRLHEQRLLEAPLAAALRIGDAEGYLNPIVLHADSVAALLQLTFRHVEAKEFAPGRVEVRGLSVVLSGSGEERALPGVLGISCAVRDLHSALSVWTLSDVWMPYSLMAQSQWAVAEFNAPRLRAALEAIEQVVGSPGFSEDSRFAKVDGYELRNYIVRGDVVDLQDMGYDESRIVESWPEPDPSDPPPGPEVS
jgi:hypothetical protein